MTFETLAVITVCMVIALCIFEVLKIIVVGFASIMYLELQKKQEDKKYKLRLSKVK